MAVANIRRRLTAGVELQGDGTAHARVWAPGRRRVDTIIERSRGERQIVALDRDGEDVFTGTLTDVAGQRSLLVSAGWRSAAAGSVSRYQPEGPHGPSALIDPSAFRWTDGEWPGVTMALVPAIGCFS